MTETSYLLQYFLKKSEEAPKKTKTEEAAGKRKDVIGKKATVRHGS